MDTSGTENPASPLTSLKNPLRSSEGSLLSTQKSSQLQAVLHPLVLLTISDYITRHTLREQKGPIIGALLGQQNGREITIEHAFECHIVEAPLMAGGYLIDPVRFSSRLEQSTSTPTSYNFRFSQCLANHCICFQCALSIKIES